MTRLITLFTVFLLLASCGKEEQKKTPPAEELPQISVDKATQPTTPPRPKIKLEVFQFKDLSLIHI